MNRRRGEGTDDWLLIVENSGSSRLDSDVMVNRRREAWTDDSLPCAGRFETDLEHDDGVIEDAGRRQRCGVSRWYRPRSRREGICI